MRIINKLIFFGILIFPLTYIGEILALIDGYFVSMSIMYTPVLFKFIKDIFILIILILLININKNQSYSSVKIFWFIIFFIVIVISLFQNEIILSILGLRWFLPFLIMTLMIDNINIKNIENISNLLFYLLIFNFIMQLFEIYFSNNFFAMNVFFIPRVPGLFGNINSSSFFIVCSLFYIFYYSKITSNKIIALIIGLFSIVICSSGTAILATTLLFIIFLMYLFRNGIFKISSPFFYILLFLFPLIFYFILINLGDITGRGTDLLTISGGERVNIFLRAFDDWEYISSRFGLATNSSNLYIDNYSQGFDDFTPIVADSFYTSILVNLGLPLSIIILLSLFASVTFSKINIYEKLSFMIITSFFFATSIFTEIFPVNFLIMILFSLYNSRKII